MGLINNLYSYRLKPSISDLKNFYDNFKCFSEIIAWQLEKFNIEWHRIYQNVPYYTEIKDKYKLPDKFHSWDEFKELMPYLDRGTVQNRVEDLTDNSKKPDFYATTGGSTGKPLQIPSWESESIVARNNLWYARSWFDIKPSDKLFLIWGHSHLLGDGVNGFINKNKRKLKDYLLRYKRISAYDLSEFSMNEAANELLRYKPDYILAYSTALDRFARVNSSYKGLFHKLNLKIAIATGESFPRTDSADYISDILGCSVVMEYGSVESGLIAHQGKDQIYSVFWKDYYIETNSTNNNEILITSLYPRCMPLIRYKLGDFISNNSGLKESTTFDKVVGRCNDYIELDNGSLIHSEAFTHILKEIPNILAFQVVQSRIKGISINYISRNQLSKVEISYICSKLKKVNTKLSDIRLKKVEKLENTVAGKTKFVIREEN